MPQYSFPTRPIVSLLLLPFTFHLSPFTFHSPRSYSYLSLFTFHFSLSPPPLCYISNMKRIGLYVLALMVGIVLAGCGGAESNTNTPAANAAAANTSATPAGPPTVEQLKALEVKAFEAYKNKDVNYFETYLALNYVSMENGKPVDRAEVIKRLGDHKDDIKGFTFSDEKVTKLGADTALLTMKAATEGLAPDGKKLPNVISATLLVRDGADWRAAWHGEVPVIDPKDLGAPAKAAVIAPEVSSPLAGNIVLARMTDTSSAGAKIARNAETASLAAIEQSVWEAWKDRDAKRLEELTAGDLAFVNIFGGYFKNRADTLKDWTQHQCEIKSVKSSDATSVAITGDTSILFHKGTADGSCMGQKIGPIFGTSIYVKEGPSWKLAFTMNSPAK